MAKDSDQVDRRKWYVLLFIVTVFAAILCQIQLQQWYSIYTRWDIPYFAYEKLPGRFDNPIIRHTVWVYLALGLLYSTGLLLLSRLRTISTPVKAGILAAWIGPGVANVLIFPIGALDVFRYMVALKAKFYYHENPYTHGFMAHKDDEFATHAFLLHLPNAKGPTWLWLSWIPSRIVGFDDQQQLLLALKVFNLLLVGLVGLMVYFGAGRGRAGWVSFFLVTANPLLLLDGVGNVHNDIMSGMFVVAALLALRRRSTTSLPLLTAATLVKYFTPVLYPVFLADMLRNRWSIRKILLSLGGSVLVAVLLVWPTWQHGDMLDGIRRVEAAYSNSMHVGLPSLERQFHMRNLPKSEWAEIKTRTDLFYGILAICLIPVYLGVLRGKSTERAANLAYGLFLLLATLLYPWYLPPLFMLMGLARTRTDTAYLIAGTTLGLLYYPFYVFAHFNSGWREFYVHLFLALFLTLPLILWLIASAIGGSRAFLDWLKSLRPRTLLSRSPA